MPIGSIGIREWVRECRWVFVRQRCWIGGVRLRFSEREWVRQRFGVSEREWLRQREWFGQRRRLLAAVRSAALRLGRGDATLAEL